MRSSRSPLTKGLIGLLRNRRWTGLPAFVVLASLTGSAQGQPTAGPGFDIPAQTEEWHVPDWEVPYPSAVDPVPQALNWEARSPYKFREFFANFMHEADYPHAESITAPELGSYLILPGTVDDWVFFPGPGETPIDVDAFGKLGSIPGAYMESRIAGTVPIEDYKAQIEAGFVANFLRKDRGRSLICDALHSLFPSSASDCEHAKAVEDPDYLFSVLSDDPVGGRYLVQLTGYSSVLVMKREGWVERHRYFISFGFDASLVPHVTVYNHKPMYKSNDRLLEREDELFHYIPPELDDPIEDLSSMIRERVGSELQAQLYVAQESALGR